MSGITQKFIRPHCPWKNGKVERLNRTLATEWAYAQPFASNSDRAAALPAWLDYYNLERRHLGIGGTPPSTESTTVEVNPARTAQRVAGRSVKGRSVTRQ